MISVNREICSNLEKDKYIVLSADEFSIAFQLETSMHELWKDWDDLMPDNYLKNGASFRLRRFSYMYFLPCTGEIVPFPEMAYFQSNEINTYAGGIQRKFAPLLDSTLTNNFLHELIKFNFRQFPVSTEMRQEAWKIDVHQIRIVATEDEAGEPAPEGIHHDEVDFGCIHLVNCENAIGGVSTAYDNDRNPLESCTLRNPMDSMIIWDPHMMHGISPIHPKRSNKQAIRDTLLIGFLHAPDLKIPE